MASDVRLQGNNVFIDGNLSVGNAFPTRPVYCETGEIHSGGSAGGFSFSDRSVTAFKETPVAGERWTWYANNAAARLWSGTDALTIAKLSSGFEARVNGELVAQKLTATRAQIDGSFAAKAISGTSAQISGGVEATFMSTTTAVISGNLTVKNIFGAALDVTAGIKAKTLDVSEIAAQKLVSGSLVSESLISESARVNVLEAQTIRPKTITQGTLDGVFAAQLRGIEEEIPNGVQSVVCRSHGLAVIDPAAPTRGPGIADQLTTGSTTSRGRSGVVAPPPPPPPPTIPIPPRLALFHDFSAERDALVLNHLRRYTGGVRVDGNLKVDGVLSEASSIELKHDVRSLTVQEAQSALQELNPVSFRYRADARGLPHLGFIAEDVPALVAQPERDRVRAMDLIAVLTTVLQEQQRALSALEAQVAQLNASRQSDGSST